jgi:hypothetical protein
MTGFHGFPQVLQTSAGIRPQVVTTFSRYFSIHQSSYCSVLYSLNSDNEKKKNNFEGVDEELMYRNKNIC